MNSNSLAFDKPGAVKFADKLAELRGQGDQNELMQEIVKHVKDGKSGDEIMAFIKSNPKNIEAYKAMHKELLTKQVEQNKNQQSALQQEALQETEDTKTKLKPTEQNVALAAQANQKQVEEAMGNAQRDEHQGHDHSDSKQNLAKWSQLAPRVIEDAKNKAVRVDIPGLEDLQTLIVRVNGSGVSIQVAGSESSMNLLEANQGQLRERLAKHDISLKEIKTVSRNTAGAQSREKGNV